MTNFENRQYKQEYEQARLKFEMLRTGVTIDNTIVTLNMLLDNTPLLWDTPEWGFPKGRRNSFESDYSCAVREFVEETGLQESDIHIFENMAPIRETFFGNNNIHYCHVYYVAWIHSSIEPQIQDTNVLMNREVGGIGWYTIENALTRIRNTNLEKREVLLRAICLLRSVSPLLIGGLATIQNTEEVAMNRSARNELINPWNRRSSRATAAGGGGGGGQSRNFQPEWNERRGTGQYGDGRPFGFIDDGESTHATTPRNTENK